MICLEALSRLLYFLTDLRYKTIKRITKSPGYDAEVAVAFDGGKTIYTSMESGDLDIWMVDSNGQKKPNLLVS